MGSAARVTDDRVASIGCGLLWLLFVGLLFFGLLALAAALILAGWFVPR